jgi:hypothetical protein
MLVLSPIIIGEEVWEVFEVWDVRVGVEHFQPVQKVGDFGLPMLVLSPIIKGEEV